MLTASTLPEQNFVTKDEALIQLVEDCELLPEEIFEEPLKILNEAPCTSNVIDPEVATLKDCTADRLGASNVTKFSMDPD